MSTGVSPSIGAFVYSNNLAMIPVEIPVIIGKSEHQAVRESDAETSAPTMSDWEYAAVTATSGSRSTTIGFTTSGPSATSAIVGFVGTIIVIGAYASSVGHNKSSVDKRCPLAPIGTPGAARLHGLPERRQQYRLLIAEKWYFFNTL